MISIMSANSVQGYETTGMEKLNGPEVCIPTNLVLHKGKFRILGIKDGESFNRIQFSIVIETIFGWLIS